MMDTFQRQQETKNSTTTTGPAETSRDAARSSADDGDLDVADNVGSGSDVGIQDHRENIGGSPAGGIAGTGGVGTNDVGQRGPGKSMDGVR